MDEKAKKAIKASWKVMTSRGGHFGMALNNFSQSPDRLPILVCNPKKEVTRQHVTAAAGEDGDISKLILGSVSLEDGKLCFNIDAASPVKSPTSLKKGLKRLAKEKDLGLGKAAKAIVRLNTELSLAGDSGIDTSAQALEKGGKVSKSAKIKKFFTRSTSRYEKLLASLDDWHTRFHDKLTSENVNEGEALLTLLEQRTKDWLDQHSKDSGDKKSEVQRIQQEVKAARKKVAAFKASLSQQEQDSDVEDLIDDLLEGSYEGDPRKRAEDIVRARQSLVRRLGAGDLDDEERRTLQEELSALQKLEDSNADTLLTSVGDISEKKPRREAMKRVQDSLSRRLESDSLSEKDAGPLLAGADTLLKKMRDDLKGDTFGETEDGKEQMRRTLSLMDAMKKAGADKVVQERKLKLMRSVKKMNDRFVLAQVGGTNWEGALGRSNNALTGARTELVKDIGRDFAESTLKSGFDAIRSNPQASLKKFDEKTAPGATKAAEDLATTKANIDENEIAIRGRLEALVIKKGSAYGIERAAVLDALNHMVSAVDLSGGTPPPLPTPNAVLSHILASDPTATARFRADMLKKLNAYLAKTSLYDSNPANTERLISQQIDAHILDGRPVSPSAILSGITPPGHWMSTPSFQGIEGPMASLGILNEDDYLEEEKGISDNQKTLDEIVSLRDNEFQKNREAFEDKASAVLTFLSDTLRDVMDSTLSDPAAVPAPIRQLIYGVMKTAVDSGGDPQKCRAVVADILILRWLAPLLSTTPFPNPSLGGKEMPSTAGGYVGKMMQNIANGTLPREPELLGMHPLIKTYTRKYNDFVDSLISTTQSELVG